MLKCATTDLSFCMPSVLRCQKTHMHAMQPPWKLCLRGASYVRAACCTSQLRRPCQELLKFDLQSCNICLVGYIHIQDTSSAEFG
eukprot:364329-Chlamydomonas_euryale.AAC.5